MYQQLIANIKANLLYFLRSRIVPAAIVFVVIFFAMTLLQPASFLTDESSFGTVRTLFKLLNTVALLLTVALCPLLVTEHLKDRSIKMIFAKPCPPGTWLLAAFLSAAIAAILLYGTSLLAASVLSRFFGIPYPSGMVLVAANEFFQALSLMACATFFVLFLHPLTALAVLLFLQEGRLYLLNISAADLLAQGTQSPYRPLWKVAKEVVRAVYLVFPTFTPYSGNTAQLCASLSISSGDGKHIALAAAYALVVITLFYVLGVVVLSKKRYV